MDVDEFAPRLSFNFTAWGKIFEEVAKFAQGGALRAHDARALRREKPKSCMFRTLIGGGGRRSSCREPRTTSCAAPTSRWRRTLGGADDALPTYDEGVHDSIGQGQLIALRTMQICAKSRGRADTVDPLAGSYYVETLTNEMEQRIQD